MKVVIDREGCIGCGSCAALCPEVFSFNHEAEKAEVYCQPPSATDQVMQAVDNCPVAVIYIEE